MDTFLELKPVTGDYMVENAIEHIPSDITNLIAEDKLLEPDDKLKFEDSNINDDIFRTYIFFVVFSYWFVVFTDGCSITIFFLCNL